MAGTFQVKGVQGPNGDDGYWTAANSNTSLLDFHNVDFIFEYVPDRRRMIRLTLTTLLLTASLFTDNGGWGMAEAQFPFSSLPSWAVPTGGSSISATLGSSLVMFPHNQIPDSTAFPSMLATVHVIQGSDILRVALSSLGTTYTSSVPSPINFSIDYNVL